MGGLEVEMVDAWREAKYLIVCLILVFPWKYVVMFSCAGCLCCSLGGVGRNCDENVATRFGFRFGTTDNPNGLYISVHGGTRLP